MIIDMITEVEAFLPRLQEQVKQNYLSWGKNSEFHQKNVPQLSIQYGKKYAKIVTDNHGQKSVFGFIDLANGNLMKAAGWNAPAKNFARGHITDADISYIRWTSIS
jgi:hypothetical protein